jgi:hypothetical protein
MIGSGEYYTLKIQVDPDVESENSVDYLSTIRPV